jgi:hypothetical protein
LLNVPAEWEIAKIPAEDERLVLVERIVASKRFRRAPQLRDMLVYVVARSLSQGSATITEHEIGSIVLGRGGDFDPGHDNIVRAQMRHLRIKLEEYFENEGSSEPLVLSIPKGHYFANFVKRPETAPDAKKAADAPPAAPQPARPRLGRLWIAPALLSAILLALLVHTWTSPPQGTVPEEYSFYENILGPLSGELATETSLVLGNPRVILYAGSPTEDASAIGAAQGVPVPAEWREKLRPAVNRADLPLPYHVLQIKENDYTGLGDATGCFHLGRLLNTLRRPANVTQARFLSWDSAMRHTLIILGSPHTNDWAHGNVPDHSFRIVKMGITNQHPRPGELELYPCVWDETGNAVSDYGLIWAWRTPSGSRVLVLAGPSSASTGAMAARFSDPDEFRPLYERMGSDSPDGSSPSNWQMLFKVDVRDNLPVRTTYVTHRVYSSD